MDNAQLFLVIVIASAATVFAEEIDLKLAATRPNKYVHERFINFHVDPADLVEILTSHSNIFAMRLHELSPSTLKIVGNSTRTLLVTGDLLKMGKLNTELSDWKVMHDSLGALGSQLVFALPYSPENWDPRRIMKIMGKVDKLDMNDVTWQLGSDFRIPNAVKYLDDLTTMRSIVDAFNAKNPKRNWKIIGSDLTIGSHENEARLYSELSKHLVDAVGWSQYSESNIDRPRSKVDNMFSILNIDPPLRTILNSRMPLWLTINDRSKIPDNSPRSNLERGLEWAQILGDASNSGFKRVFAQVNEHNFFKQTLTHYTMLLHKKLMGETVLDLETTRGDQLETHVYAHCAKNRSGAFTIFALNTGYEESLVTLRIPPMKAGSEYDEYILTMNSENGNVRLNDEDLYEDSPLIPNLKMRRLMRPISLTLPARSIGFWTFPEALLSECDSPPVSRERRYSPSVRTSSEKLLHELILEEIEREEATENNSINKRARRGIAWNSVLQKVQMNSIKQEKNKNKRSRRSVGDTVRFPRADKFVNQLYNGIDDLKRLHIHSPLAGRINTIPSRVRRQTLGLNSLSRLLEKMEFRKPNLLFKSKLNFKNGLIPPISTIHDIYEPNTPERAIFKSIENTNLPTGDVHMEIGDDRVHDLNIASMVPSQTPNAVLPVQHYEHPVHTDYYENTAPELSAPEISAYKQIENLPAGQYEMYEFDNGQSHVPEVLVAQPEPNVSAERNIDTIVPDNQPNWETDRDNYQKARENIQQYYVPNSEHTIDTILPNFDNKKISTFLPNLARGASIFNKPQSFDTRRKRRSIDSKMNDEIEEKVHKMESPDDEDETLFNKMAKMIMKNQENEFADAQLRCRIVSKSIEQRCLDSNSHPFIPNVKREMDESKSKKPYKEMKKKLVKSKTNEKNREKRSILFSMESNELADNDVRREIYEHLDNLKEMKSPYETKDDRKTIHVQFYNRVTEGFPRMVETVEKTVKDIAGVVRGQIFRIFESWY